MDKPIPDVQRTRSRMMPSIVQQFISILLFLIFVGLSLAVLVVQTATPATVPMSTIVLVWNGMRPDMVSSVFTPHLAALGDAGVIALDHHAVAPTTELVNSAALAGGTYPGTNQSAPTGSVQDTGIISDRPILTQPTANVAQPAQLSDPQVQASLQQLLPDGLLQTSSLQYIAARAGLNVSAEGTGGTASLQQLDAQLTNTSQTVIGIDDQSIQPTTIIPDLQKHGYLSNETIPAHWTDDQLTQIFTQVILPRFNASSAPFLSIIDFHAIMSAAIVSGMGSVQMTHALQQTDAELGAVIADLQRLSLHTSVNIIVTSDHGMQNSAGATNVQAPLFTRMQTEINKGVAGDLPDLQSQGISDGDQATQTSIDFIETGATIAVTIPVITDKRAYPDDLPKIQANEIAHWLQKQPDIGVILANDQFGSIAGTIAMSQVHLESNRSPALLVTLAAQPMVIGQQDNNFSDYQGTAVTYDTGKAVTGSLSSRDLHTIFYASGPSFKQSASDVLPTGIIDVAPTIEHIMDIPIPSTQQGRVLDELLVNDTTIPPQQTTSVIASEATILSNGQKYISVVHVEYIGKTLYISGGAAARGSAAAPDKDLLQLAEELANQG